jgi:hypothetical protein
MRKERKVSQSQFRKTSIGTPLGLALALACLAATPAHAGTDQLWRKGDNGDGKINTSLVNFKDGHCMDAENQTAANGTPVIVYDCKRHEDDSEYAQSWNERWRASPSSDPNYGWANYPNGSPATLGYFWHSIAVGDNWGACVDVPSGNDVNGQPLQIYQCNGTPAQVWRSGSDNFGESPFWLRSNITGQGVNRCMTNWGRVVLYDCAYDF